METFTMNRITNRKFLLAPLILASMTAFSAHADNALGGFQNIGARNGDSNNIGALRANRANAVNASRADSLTSARANLRERIADRADARDNRDNRADASRARELFDGDRLDNVRDAARDRRENAQERRDERREDRRALGRDVAVLNAANNEDSALRDRLEARRASLPGLEEADAGTLRDRLPKVTTDSDRDGDTRTRTLSVDGQNGDFKLTNVVESHGPDASDRSSGERSLDRTLKIQNTVEGSRETDGSAIAQRSSSSNFKRTSSLDFDRSGEVKARTEDSARSRSVDNRLSMNSSNESSFRSSGRNSDSGDVNRSNSSNFGFTSTSSSDRSGLERAERSRDVDYDFDLGNRGS
jgi:hypothetical protein